MTTLGTRRLSELESRPDASSSLREVVDPRNGTEKMTTKSVKVNPDGIACRIINVDEQRRIIREGMAR